MLVNRPWLAAAALAAALSVAAIAQIPAEKPGAPDPSRVTGGTYTADPNHTLVGWRVDHLGFSDYFGLFGEVTGTLQLDPANPGAAKVDVFIPIKPVVASAALGEHLLRPGKDGKAPDFFGSAQAPARFVSTEVHPLEDGVRAHMIGTLTLNGVTRPVEINARFNGAGTMMGKETVGFEGRAKIRRSDFGLGTGIPLVGDEVELDISAAFEKASGEPAERPDPGPNACNADKATPWIGKKATTTVRTAVAKATGAKAIRWIRPDMAVTADYSAGRLNVQMDKADVIRSARCG